jgi:hypothetical protein
MSFEQWLQWNIPPTGKKSSTLRIPGEEQLSSIRAFLFLLSPSVSGMAGRLLDIEQNQITTGIMLYLPERAGGNLKKKHLSNFALLLY